MKPVTDLALLQSFYHADSSKEIEKLPLDMFRAKNLVNIHKFG